MKDYQQEPISISWFRSSTWHIKNSILSYIIPKQYDILKHNANVLKTLPFPKQPLKTNIIMLPMKVVLYQEHSGLSKHCHASKGIVIISRTLSRYQNVATQK
jgi:hypothetical protein